MGLYRLAQGDLTRGDRRRPRGAARIRADDRQRHGRSTPVAEPTRGGILRLEDGAPDIRAVREGRVAAGRGWIGITPREAYVTQDVRMAPLLPAWACCCWPSVLAVAAWLREGRR